jgi:hypothetical protein
MPDATAPAPLLTATGLDRLTATDPDRPIETPLGHPGASSRDRLATADLDRPTMVDLHCPTATDLTRPGATDLDRSALTPVAHPAAADLDRLGDEIATLSAHLDAATARLLSLLREFDARGGWATGFRSCAEWLSWRAGLDLGAARERVRVARALGELPLLTAALARGELSYAKVRALTRVATPATEARLLAMGLAGTAAHVERLVRAWRRVDRQLEAREAAARHRHRSLQVYPDEDGMFVVRGRLEPEVGALLLRALEAAREALYAQARTAGPAQDRGTAGTARDPGGAGAARASGAAGTPDAAGAAETLSAGRAAAEQLDGDPSTPGQQRADALALVAETALQHGFDPGIGSEQDQVRERDQASERGRAGERERLGERDRVSERYQVVVHVDAPVLADPAQPGQCALEDGIRVSAETARRLACDATRVVVRHAGDANRGTVRHAGNATRVVVRHAGDATEVAWHRAGEGSILDMGRRTRTIPPALRRALQARDRGCRFPGCGVRHTQGHHLRHWADGGPTRLDNLALVCRRHHRALHEEGYQVTRDADGTLHFRTPSGRPIPEVPAPPPVPREPSRALVAANRARGLAIGPRTGCPSWLGERLDLGYAIDVLHPAAQRAAAARQVAAEHVATPPTAAQHAGHSP